MLGEPEVDYTLVMPVFNEEARIAPTLKGFTEVWTRVLARAGKTYELIAVLNGCTDRSPEIIRRHAGDSASGCIRVLSIPSPNKGKAVLAGLSEARGAVVGFADSDGAILPHEMLAIMRTAETGVVCIGSKRHPRTRCSARQPLPRRIASVGWNILVRLVLGLRLSDTQAGAKAMPAGCARRIVHLTSPCRYAFDVSLLWEAKRAGYEICEQPLTWQHVAGSKFKLWQEAPRMLIALLRVRAGFADRLSDEGIQEMTPPRRETNSAVTESH